MKRNIQGKRKLMNSCSSNNSTNGLEKKEKILKQSFNETPSFGKGFCNESGIKIKSELSNKNKRNQNQTDVGILLNRNQEFKEKNDMINVNQPTFLNKESRSECLNNNNLTNVARKGNTGSNNWEKFLLEQGKKYFINKRPAEVNEYSKTKTKTFSNIKNKSITKVLGMDCEMVGAGENGKDNLLARVSIVNLYGDCLYDKFVKPREKVTDYRTHVSGVRASDLLHADDFYSVQKDVAALIKGKILVGHAIKNDLEVLFLSHPKHQIRDTAKFFRKRGTGTPSLKNLALEYLNVKIQSGEHSSVQDAQAAVQLYNMYRKQWETGGGNKKNNRIDT